MKNWLFLGNLKLVFTALTATCQYLDVVTNLKICDILLLIILLTCLSESSRKFVWGNEGEGVLPDLVDRPAENRGYTYVT